MPIWKVEKDWEVISTAWEQECIWMFHSLIVWMFLTHEKSGLDLYYALIHKLSLHPGTQFKFRQLNGSSLEFI